MRIFIFAAAAATVLAMSGLAQAAAPGPFNGLGAAVDELNMVENAQFVFGGRRHCWYARGWNGAGWYQCGYQARKGRGWGGGEGWNGWERRRVERREDRREDRR